MTGYCKFCGQSFMAAGIDNEEEANEQATMSCKCDKAIDYKRVVEMKETACGNSDALFQDQSEEVRQLLRDAVNLIAERKINSISVKISSRLNANLKKGSDSIVIKRKYTEENTLES